MDILLYSNGKANKDQNLLEYGLKDLQRQVEENKIKNYVLIPYAIIRDTYQNRANDLMKTLAHMNVKVSSISDFKDPIEAIAECDGIAVSGGNTWYLNRCLHDFNLVNKIREEVLLKNKPFVGWSAGTNIAAPTMLTTNDMPIVGSLITTSLNFVPFQINPHYIDKTIDGHMGESRDDRIVEFLAKNTHQKVVGLREGSWLKLNKGKLSYDSYHNHKLKIFTHNEEPVEYSVGDDMTFLLNSWYK
ncbi:MAG: dipeptidase PepE [Alphaproteobacteria bacterium]|jgi:dipeptidase E|nr:dipeptidase PepE [Alphaproteobacteria bacterium]